MPTCTCDSLCGALRRQHATKRWVLLVFPRSEPTRRAPAAKCGATSQYKVYYFHGSAGRVHTRHEMYKHAFCCARRPTGSSRWRMSQSCCAGQRCHDHCPSTIVHPDRIYGSLHSLLPKEMRREADSSGPNQARVASRDSRQGGTGTAHGLATDLRLGWAENSSARSYASLER